MTNFDIKECNSAKAIALKGNTDINVTSRFIDGEMLMFPKISLKSFVYDIIDVFCFPTEDVKMIYNKHDIIKCHMYLNLIDMYSSSSFFDFICKEQCNIKESKSRNLILQILKKPEIVERLDVSAHSGINLEYATKT